MVRDIIEKNEKVNPNADLLKKLKSLIPGVIAKDGSIDADAIRYWAERATGDSRLVTEERETFNFLGKDYARLLYALDTETVITPDKENNTKSENKNSENLYLSGDNLEVLKHLRRSYEGEVKCIYIDPPYNTGSDDFVYNDSFDFTEKDLKEKLGLDDDAQVEKIMNMRKRGSRSHAAWLTFMYPRLKLARDLLKDDGVIFISIDDNEQANLKILCDEIFGEENFINNFVWVNKPEGRQISGLGAAGTHEYILVYSKNAEKIGEFLLDFKTLNKSMPIAYKNNDHEIKEDEKGKYITTHELYNGNSIYNEQTRPNLVYDIYYREKDGDIKISDVSNKHLYNGYVKISPHKNADGIHKYHAYRWEKEKVFRDKCDLEFIKSGDSFKVYTKRRDYDITSVKDYITDVSTSNGTQDLKKLKIQGFNHPKPEKLIELLIKFAISEYDDNSEKNKAHQNKEKQIVLDFFSGSGTTAHSVINTNRNSSDNLRFIAIQLDSNLDAVNNPNDTTKNAIKFLDSIHKPHTLDQIGMERIRRAAAKIKEEHPGSTCDFGFKHYTIQKPTEKSLDTIKNFEPNPNFGEATILKQFGVKTVLATWMVDDGHTFNANVEEIDLNGYTAYKVNDYLYLINGGIEDKHIKSLFKKYDEDKNFKPKHLVLFGYSFGMTTLDTLKTNAKNVDGIDIHTEMRY